MKKLEIDELKRKREQIKDTAEKFKEVVIRDEQHKRQIVEQREVLRINLIIIDELIQEK